MSDKDKKDRVAKAEDKYVNLTQPENRIIGFTSAGNRSFGDEVIPITEQDMKDASAWYIKMSEEGMLPSQENQKPAISELLKEMNTVENNTNDQIELVDLDDFQDGNDQDKIVGYTSMDEGGPGGRAIAITQRELDEAEQLAEELFKDLSDDRNLSKQIHKSSRHSKITGDFAENIVLYWLSKYGYECARIDHVGVDLIARRPSGKLTMGISVKSRSRESMT